MVASNKEAYKLFHEGTEALAQVERNGIRIDTNYVRRTQKWAADKCESIKEELYETEFWERWKKKYRRKADLGSPDQLADILYEKYEPKKRTAKGKPSTDEDALLATGEPFVKRYLDLRKLNKVQNTYLDGILRECWDGYLHPVFGLSRAVTFRSNSDTPNFQNIPIRDPRLGKMIRRAFIPREGWKLIEIDYSAIEVRIAACYHKDPTMLRYIKEGYDLHKDMAGEVFKLKPAQITKAARQVAKGGFVFAEFYGNWYKAVAKNLWFSAKDLTVPCVACGGGGASSKGGECVPCEGQGSKTMHEHLATQGCASLAAYTNHIEKVERRFWKERFPKYDKWREHWYKKYLDHGYFQMKTGFVCQGVLKRNEIINYAVQGAAFHCLLWSLTQLVRELPRRGFEALVVGQIHDSVMLDVPPEEEEDVLRLANDIMTRKLREHWAWIITPLEIEAEGSTKNWYEKEEIKIPA